jgi:hypothetical protein
MAFVSNNEGTMSSPAREKSARETVVGEGVDAA